jgi:hypothetical protein
MAIKMPPRGDDQKAAAFIAEAPGAKAQAGKAVVNLRMRTDLLARIDADARRLGISRTAWLHIAANRALEG